MERQIVKSECPPADQATNGYDATSQPSNLCNSARDKELNTNSARKKQMESLSSNVQRTSGQKLHKTGIENIEKQATEVKREVKEEEPDDIFNTDVRGENSVLCPKVNEVDVNPRLPNITEDTETVVASPQLFRPINDPLKIIARRNWLPTDSGPAGKKEFRSKMQFKPEEEMPRLERMDDVDLMRSISIDATTSAENKGSFNDPAACTVEENFDNAPFAWELDSNVQDGQIGRSLDDIGSQANDVNQLFLGTNEEEPSEMPVLNKEQLSEPDTFACLDCPAVFKTKKTFEKHISSHDDYRRYQCSLCEKRFKERSGLLRHKKYIQRRNWLPTDSGHAGKKEVRSKMQFKPEEEMPRLERMNDIDLMRSISIGATTSSDNEGSSNYPAASTVEENFHNAPSAWELDSDVQDGQIGRSLDDIGSQANDENKLFLGTNEEEPSEMPVLNKERSCEPDKFACLDCPAVFKTTKMFLKHISSQDDYRRYRCFLCEKRFKEKRSLLRHERIHSGEKPFKCPTCDEYFIQSQTCIEHQRKHTGERPFRCEDCGKTFAHKSTYITHERIHSGDKPHSCKFCIACKIPFSTREEMVSHKQQNHGNGSETVNLNQIAASDAVPNISTVQGLNPKSSVVTSHENNDGSALENSTAFIEMSPELSIDSDIIHMVEVDSTQSGSSARKRNASDIEENHPILVKKSTKKAAEISTIHAETCNDIEHSFLDNEITTDPLSSVPHEQVDDTNFMEKSNAPELDASQRIQYKRRSMENIVEKAARKNPHILYIVWSEDFSLDVAAVVSRHESNCVLFVQNLLPSSLFDVYSLSQDFKLQTPKVNVGIFSEPLHCFDFGDLGLPMKISKESAFESFTKVESKMTKFARTKGMDLVNILGHPKDAISWCNQLLQQLKGSCIISNSA